MENCSIESLWMRMKRAIVRESFLSVLVFTQRQFSKIRDQQRINDNGINLFGGQEGKKIDMVAACGFHACHDSREVFTVRSNSLHQFRKAGLIHSQRQREPYISLNIKTCGRKESLETSTPTNSLLIVAPP